MVRTRSGASTRDDSVELPRRANLGSHPSGDLHVPSQSRVEELTDVIAHLSPRKPGARIFDLIARAESAGDESAYGTPPDSPNPGENTFEAMGELDFEFQLPPADDPPGLTRQTPPINFAQAHEWRLGRIDEAALNYEQHDISGAGNRARRREAFAGLIRSLSEASNTPQRMPETPVTSRSASPGPSHPSTPSALISPSSQLEVYPEDVPLPEDSSDDRTSPERVVEASGEPEVKVAHPAVPEYDPTKWQIVRDGTHLYPP